MAYIKQQTLLPLAAITYNIAYIKQQLFYFLHFCWLSVSNNFVKTILLKQIPLR
jgi:hypothetical protein